MDLIVLPPQEEAVQEKVSLKSNKPKVVQAKHETNKVELSENIRRFDKQVKVYTSNPYAHHSVIAKSTERNSVGETSQTANQMITNPTYNSIGKFLGVDTLHDWGRYYDKVYTITEWAKQKVGDNSQKIAKWLTDKLNSTPSMGTKRIDDLYIAAKLDLDRRHK